MLLEKNVVGKKTDWANYITLSDEHETPLLKRLPKGDKPVNVVKHYQADTYETPTPVAWPEGKSWDTFSSAGAQRKELSARVQYVVQTASVGKLAQDVTDTAGVSDELSREITKKMTTLARQIECHAACDQPAAEDDGKTGHMFRGIGKWIQTTAQSDADKDVASDIRPASAQISTVASNSLTEDIVRGMLESMWQATGKGSRNVLGVLGWKTMTYIAELFQFYTTGSAIANSPTQSTARVQTRDPSSGTLGTNIRTYESVWGTVELLPTKWNQYAGFSGGSATYNPYRSYFLHPDMWAWHWNQKPTVYQPEYKGGAYTCAIEAIVMLMCKNPIAEAKWAPAS